ncbi:MAG: Na+/H+ antiporter subunit E [Wolbachia endosymbiont of Meromenopon meropis]|nr:Na+/H+ antiporter subunit E [Wolbachia endosymbiont of Meromenopon meropis]
MNLKQKVNFFFIFFVTLFFLWIILSCCFEPFFIFCGIFSSIFVLFIFKRLINTDSILNQILNNIAGLSFFRLILYYVPWLVYQIILSSIYITKKILKIKLKLKPITILKECKGHNDKSITLFANSITITPGTLTISVIKKQQQVYLSIIHLIDKSFEKSISELENKVLKILYKSK